MSSAGNPSGKRTIIEDGSELRGSLTSSCAVTVRGRIDGEIETPSLTVSPSGTVHGRAKVGQVESEGEISGEFEADVVRLAGSVKDNSVIRARTLEVSKPVTFGNCELNVGEEPVDPKSVERRRRQRNSVQPPAAEVGAQGGGEPPAQ